MSHFPVSNSNLSAAHLAQFIREKYNTGNSTKCRILKAGINDTYLVEGESGKFVFRVYNYNWRTETEILEEIKLLTEFKNHNISVSYPITDHSGNFLQEFAAPEGTRFGLMFSYAAGKKILNFNTEIHFHIGSLMARMHLVAEKLQLDRVTYTGQVLVVDSLKKLETFLPENTPETEFMLSTQSYLLSEIAGVKTEQIRHGAVHMDLWFDNLNISDSGEVTFFDFDFCGNGWLCMDLAYYILQVHSTEKNETERNQKVAAFLKGYESVTALTAEEKRIIPMLGVCLYFFYLGIQAERYDNWSNVFFNDLYLQRYISLLVKPYFERQVIGNESH